MRRTHALISARSGALNGTVRVPGDKSMSHRALMLGLLAHGETMISGLLESDDVFCTAEAVRRLGARVSGGQDGLWRVFGVGTGHLREPDDVLDMGNSGTSARLLMGLVAGHPVTAVFTGDSSLRKRPMARVIAPLTQMGAQILARGNDRLPLCIRGADHAKGMTYEMPVASAQVKSAILLAGLNASGLTTVIETVPTRDYTETMLRQFGANIKTERTETDGCVVTLDGAQMLRGCAVDIPGDPSSAAFPVVAALIREGSQVRLVRVGVSDRRTGLYDTLREMGADISFEKVRDDNGVSVADIVVRSGGPLKGVDVPPQRVAAMIDEFPVLAVAASCADGVTRMTGLAELRVKESDRLAKMAQGLTACGVKLEEGPDSLIIYGNGKPPQGGAVIDTALDHRIAMSFLTLGCACDEPIVIDDCRPIDTSFPGFTGLMNGLGALIEEQDAFPALSVG